MEIEIKANNSPFPKAEERLRTAIAEVFGDQAQAVIKKIESIVEEIASNLEKGKGDGIPKGLITSLSDDVVVEKVSPVVLSIIKAGGDAGLRNIRKLNSADALIGKASKWVHPHIVYHAEKVGEKELQGIVAYIVKGGPGSGHFGHHGRPGEVGGSSDSDSDSSESHRRSGHRRRRGERESSGEEDKKPDFSDLDGSSRKLAMYLWKRGLDPTEAMVQAETIDDMFSSHSHRDEAVEMILNSDIDPEKISDALDEAIAFFHGSYTEINRERRKKGTGCELLESLVTNPPSGYKNDEDVLYRGLSFGQSGRKDYAFLQSLKIGTVIKDDGFISTTKSKSVAKDFADSDDVAVTMEITGTKGIGFSVPEKVFKDFGNEKEVLLPPGSRFTITDIVKKPLYGKESTRWSDYSYHIVAKYTKSGGGKRKSVEKSAEDSSNNDFKGRLFDSEGMEIDEDVSISQKASPPKTNIRDTVVLGDWIKQPEVVKAAKAEMYRFAHSINKTTANLLREAIVAGLANGDNIRHISNTISMLHDEWAEGYRAERIARTETMRAYTFGTINAWKASGVVQNKVWLASEDACPFCRKLDGTMVPIDKPFAKLGETLDAEWNGQEILMDIDYTDIQGPPLHPNCRCDIVADLDHNLDDFEIEGQEDEGEGVQTQEERISESNDIMRPGVSLFDLLAGKSIKGGSGSGNFGHSGRPGEVGGSSPDTSAVFHPGPNRRKPSKGGKWTLTNGDPVPDHIGYLPPKWKNVKINMDPKANLIAVGTDKKGRVQSKYSKEFRKSQDLAKFARVRELMSKKYEISQQIRSQMKSDDPVTAEAASCLSLIFHTGIRPGSDEDTKAEKQAYGATTLLGKHVVVEGDSVKLVFVGKKGVDLEIPIENKDTAKLLIYKASMVKKNGQIFGVSDKQLLDFAHSLDGGSFKTKDFRTMVGTETAISTMKGMEVPKTEKEFKKSVMEVAKSVSAKLGNTPVVALQSYIDPLVFTPWRSIWDGQRVIKKGFSLPGMNGDIYIADRMSDDDELPDWRKVLDLENEEDPDDELLDHTPFGVVDILGFDPLIEYDEWDEVPEDLDDDTPENKGGSGSGNFGHRGRPGEVGGSSDEGTIQYGGSGELKGIQIGKGDFIEAEDGTDSIREDLRKSENRSKIDELIDKRDNLLSSITDMRFEYDHVEDVVRKEELLSQITKLGIEKDDVNSQITEERDRDYSAELKSKVVEEVSAVLAEDKSFDPKGLADFNRSTRYAKPGMIGFLQSTREEQIKAVVDSVVDQWAQSSSDHSTRALVFQLAVAKEFKLSDSAVKRVEDAITKADIENHDMDRLKYSPRHVPALRQVARAIYEHTQERLDAIGVQSASVWRGTSRKDADKLPVFYNEDFLPKVGKKDNTIELGTNPLSSWSITQNVAKSFLGTAGGGRQPIIMKTTVPKEAIFSIPTTGLGCLDEDEVVVLGVGGKAKGWRR